jgi:multiple sugar transport system substrate-binding protein
MTERVAMVVAGQWVCLDLGVNTELNWDVGVLPKLKNTINVIQGGTIAISETTKNKAEAWKLYKWFNNAETVLPLHSSGLWMPSMKKWYTDETFIAKWASGNPAHPANFRTAILDTTLKNGMPAPNLNVKNTNEMDSLINAALDQVWLGEKSAAQALGEIEGQLNSLVKGYYDPSRKY